MTLCVCNLIQVTMFPEWLSGTEPCVRAHVHFCRFDKADATAEVQ